jgi:hypothetical protein
MGAKSISLLILSCVLLTACATREEIAAKKAAAEQVAQAEREKHCTQSGISRGHPLSRPLLPGSPALPDSSGAIRSHWLSLNINRIKADLHFQP